MITDSHVETPADETGTEPERQPARWRGIVAWVLTGVGTVLLFFALTAPNELSRVTPLAFVRIPAEALIVLVLALVVPPKARRVLAALTGAGLAVVALVKVTDMGFYTAFDRPFNPVFDWSFFPPAIDLLQDSAGEVGAMFAIAGIAVVAIALVALMAFSAARLARLAASHRTGSARTAAVLVVVWIVCAVFGVQLEPGTQVASRSAAGLTYRDARELVTGLADKHEFAAESAVDAFRDVPGDQLLTALRGKDVLLTFVESYGRVAIQDSDIAGRVGAVLDSGTERLRAAGFDARSAFLTSSTNGGGSWLAHSTFQSGLWVNNQQRYNTLVEGDRFSLTHAFDRAGWRTVGDVPANAGEWPEGKYYRFDQYYDSGNVGYRGPRFGYADMPDQFILSALHQAEFAKPDHPPVMAEVDLLSSHWPWAPLPQTVDWDAVGDGSIFNPRPAAGKTYDQVWKNDASVRAAYGDSIEYSLNTLISYVEKYGKDNLVLVFLGDHQPDPVVTGKGATHDVPITIVAHDPAVLDRIANWGWADGLKPGPKAPVWPMNTFRDQFLTAFGPAPNHPAH